MRRTTSTGPDALSTLLSDADAVKILFRFINSTRRFERPYGDLFLADDTEGSTPPKKRKKKHSRK
ncbi:hypothetical protein J132_02717 [Termitomyces sp. J132]|nr:hypothetical protein J132_02717 [Termitomyces sp. J132]